MSDSNRTSALVCLVLGAAALWFSAPLLSEIRNWGALDWDFQLYHHGVPRATLLDYGQIPLWNPFNRSGVPMLAHPESRVLSPGFALTLLFGEVVGLKLEVVLHLMLAMAGLYRLLRHFEATPIGAGAGAIVFALNSFFALHVTVGHVWALSFAWLPWLILAYEHASKTVRRSLFASAVLIVILFSGAPYPFMISALLLVCHAAARAIADRKFALHGALLVAIFLQVGALSAIKLVPTVELMSSFPRTTPAESGYEPGAFANALFDPDQTLSAARSERPQEFNATPLHEGMYVGFVAAALFVVGVFARGRQRLGLLAIAGSFFWISLGQHAPVDLWRWLHQLPGFDNMRMVQRFAIVGVMVVALFAGFGADFLWKRSPVAALAVAAALLLELMFVNRPVMRDAFPISPLETEVRTNFEQSPGLPYYDAHGWVIGRRPIGLPALSSLYPAFLSLRGSTRGYQIVPFESHGVPVTAPAYRGEVYAQSGVGAVYTHWSPNRLAISLDRPADRDTKIVVNQNHAPGWRARAVGSETSDARRVESDEGLLTVAVHAGDQQIELRYRPTSFTIGASISAAATLGLGVWAAWPRIRRAPRSDQRLPTAS